MRTYKALNLTLAVLFAIFAGAQIDGPDPVRDGLVYGTASVLCGLTAANRAPPPLLTLLFAVVCGVLALANGVPGSPSDPVGRELEWPAAAAGRQAIGLIVVALWMAVVARVTSRAHAKRGTRSTNLV